MRYSQTSKFKTIDFIGYKPDILVEGGSRFGTAIGAFLSTLIIILSLGCSLYFLLSFINKDQIYTIVSKEPFEEFPEKIVEKGSFEIMIGFEDQSYAYYDINKTMEINLLEISFHLVNGSFTTEVRDIPVKKCDQVYSAKELKDNYGFILPINLFFCPDYSAKAKIKNYWGKDNYYSLAFTVSKCKNSTLNNNSCYSLEEINRRVQGGYVSFFFSNYMVSPKNLTHPVKYFIDQNFQILNSGGSVSVNYNVNPITFSTDVGSFFESIDTIKAYQNYPPLVFYEFTSTDVVCKILFDGASQGYRTTRIFSKLQDLLTRIGGTINAFVVAGVILNYFLSESFFVLYLHGLFSEKSDDRKIKKLKKERNERSKANSEMGSQIGGSSSDKISFPGMSQQQSPILQPTKLLDPNSPGESSRHLRIVECNNYLNPGGARPSLKNLDEEVILKRKGKSEVRRSRFGSGSETEIKEKLTRIRESNDFDNNIIILDKKKSVEQQYKELCQVPNKKPLSRKNTINDSTKQLRISKNLRLSDYFCFQYRKNSKALLFQRIFNYINHSLSLEYFSYKLFELEFIKILLLNEYESHTIKNIFKHFIFNYNSKDPMHNFLNCSFFESESMERESASAFLDLGFEEKKKLIFYQDN